MKLENCRVWLCEEPVAKHPLFLEEERLNLYSFEELCFYLYQNTGVIEESFFNERLFQWLEQETNKENLALLLRRGIEQERSGCWCMRQILKSSGYYSSLELKETLKTAEWMEHKSSLERAKLRGDRLLKAEKYKDAISEYQKVLKQVEQEPNNLKIICHVWHNIGTAYARQMLFEPAAECYEKAYKIGQEKKSKDAYLLSLSRIDGQELEGTTDRLKEFRQKLEETKQSGDRNGYEKMLEEMLQYLRMEYRKNE
ncbi:MAG: hypothetical protein K1V96_03080 [Lachnospiraceae bacterium]